MLVVLAGCSFARPLGRNALEYNRTLANEANQQLLLNVARAAKKHPLYFTEISVLHREISGEGSLNLTYPWAREAFDTYQSVGSVTGTGSANFDLGPLTQQEFMRGITTPVTADLLAYYWNQGWPAEILLRLFVRKIVVDGDTFEGGLKHGEYAKYEAAVRYLAGFHDLDTDVDPDNVGPAVPTQLDSPDTLAAIVEAGKGDMHIVSDEKDKTRLVVQKDGPVHLVFDSYDDKRWPGVPGAGLDPRVQCLVAALGDTEGRVRVGSARGSRKEVPSRLQRRKETKHPAEPEGGDVPQAQPPPPASPAGRRCSEEHAVTIYLRSPEAVIYHLGEIAREELENHLNPVLLFSMRNKSGENKKLFSVRGCGACGVSATYCDYHLCVSGDKDEDESMHVMSLVSQILGMQKSADELPKSATVNLVGGKR